MKNEELFDLITELKVDDRFIEETISDDLDERPPIKAYARNTKCSPMRIIALAAACLAVIAGAGLLFANRDKPPIRTGSPTSYRESKDNSAYENTSNDAESSGISIENTVSLFDEAFIENCKSTVKEKFHISEQSNVTWHMNIIDIDFESHIQYELLLYPQINGETVKDAGVCIFKRNPNGGAEYIGSFGHELRTIPLEELYRVNNIPTQNIYYYHNSEEYEKCTESIYALHFNKDTKALQEKTYLQLVTTYPDNASSGTPYTETAYRNGIEISTEELLEEWNSIPRLPKPGILSVHSEAVEQVQLLIDKYNVPININQLHRTVKYMDINNDGVDETLIEFKNFDALRGIYVFSSYGKLIGELDPEGERGRNIGINGTSLRTLTDIRMFENGGERYYYYLSQHYEKNGTNADSHSYFETAINKIIVNEDGTLSTEKYLTSARYAAFSNQPEPDQYDFYDYVTINGKKVSYDEFQDIWKQFDFTEHTNSLWY